MLQECSRWTALPGITMKKMVQQFDEQVASYGFPWKLRGILPKCLVAGQDAGCLTEEGAKLLDVTGRLKAGIPMCPPEGDAGTGMVATNSVAKRTGNVSAGTSVFASLFWRRSYLQHILKLIWLRLHPDIRLQWHTPNNCTSDLNAWVNIFREFAEAMGMEADMNKLFGTLYNKALKGMWTAADFYPTAISPVSI